MSRRPPPSIEGLHSLKVDNISYNTTQADLRRIFDKYGEIGDIHIPRDKYSRQSKGFGFVRFYSRRDAEYAQERTDGKWVDGRELRVALARYERPIDERGRYRSRSPRRRSRSRSPRYSRSPRRSRSRSPSRSRSRSGSRTSGRARSRSPRRRTRSASPKHSPQNRRVKSESRSRSPERRSAERRSVERSASRGHSSSPSKSRSGSPSTHNE